VLIKRRRRTISPPRGTRDVLTPLTVTLRGVEVPTHDHFLLAGQDFLIIGGVGDNVFDAVHLGLYGAFEDAHVPAGSRVAGSLIGCVPGDGHF
jgi:hypothetical protein